MTSNPWSNCSLARSCPPAQLLSVQAFIIQWLYAKPKEPWKGQKAVLVFARLYNCTVILVGVSTALFFLNTTTFPKVRRISQFFNPKFQPDALF